MSVAEFQETKYLKVIEQLITNAKLRRNQEKNTDGYENNKKTEKPNVLKYHYFDVNIRIGEKTYWVRLECEENKKASKGGYAKHSKNSSRGSKNINQTNNDVKMVHLYNIKEMKANKNIQKTLYQETNDEKLIAGFTYNEVLDKLTELYDKLADDKNTLSEQEENDIQAKIHVLEDAFDVAENPHKYPDENKRTDIMLNAYYVMNNQNIPEDYIEEDSKSLRTYRDLKEIHYKKKEEEERKYRGYFTKDANKKPSKRYEVSFSYVL